MKADQLLSNTIDPLADPRWDRLVADQPSRLFLSRRWMSFLADFYGFGFGAQVIESSGRLIAGVPFVHLDDLRGQRIVSLPFSDVVEPVVADPQHWDLLISPLLQLGVPVQFRTFDHPLASADRRLQTGINALWHGVDTTRSVDEIIAGLHRTMRSNVRSAEKHGVVVRASHDRRDLDAFYALHTGVRKYSHGLLPQPFAFFEALWANYVDAGDGAIVVASVDDEVQATVFVLGDGDQHYYKFTASSPAGRTTCAGHAATLGAMVNAVEAGASVLDLGRSDLDQDGLIRYKRGFATAERSLALHTAGRPDERAAAVGAMLGDLTTLLVRPDVPDEVTAMAGERLYRYFA